MTKRERITLRAKEILASEREGIRWSELVRRLRESFPGEPEGNLTGNTYNLHRRFPDEIYKPARGLFRFTRFRSDEAFPVSNLPQETGRAREETMNTLSEALKTVRTKIAQYKGKDVGETNTKTALIDPILRALGWHVGDLDEVRQEYKRRPKDKPVDYALILLGTPCLFVEAKALGQSLEDRRWSNQIIGYATVAGIAWVVITNGDEYRIYNALAPVHAEDKLLCLVCVSSEDARVEETLSLLSKEGLSGNLLSRNDWKVRLPICGVGRGVAG